MSLDLALYEDIFQGSSQVEDDRSRNCQEVVDKSLFQEKTVLLKTINELANENRKLQKDNELYKNVIKKLEEEKDMITHNFKRLVIVSRREMKRLSMRENFLNKKLKRHGLYAPAAIRKSENQFQSIEEIPVSEEIEYSTLLNCIRSSNELKEEKDERKHRFNESHFDSNPEQSHSSLANSEVRMASSSAQKESNYPEVKNTQELIEAVDGILDSTAYQVIDYLMRHRKTAEEWFKKNNTHFSTDGKNLMIGKENRPLRSLNISSENAHVTNRPSSKPPSVKDKSESRDSRCRSTSMDHSQKRLNRDRGSPKRNSFQGNECSQHLKHSNNIRPYSSRGEPVPTEYSHEYLSPISNAGKLKLLAKTPPSAEDDDAESKSSPGESRRGDDKHYHQKVLNTTRRRVPAGEKSMDRSSHPDRGKYSTKIIENSSRHYDKSSSNALSPLSKSRKRYDRDEVKESQSKKVHTDKISREDQRIKKDSRHPNLSPRSEDVRKSSHRHSNRNSVSPCSRKSRKSSFYDSKEKRLSSSRDDEPINRLKSSSNKSKEKISSLTENSRISSRKSSRSRSSDQNKLKSIHSKLEVKESRSSSRSLSSKVHLDSQVDLLASKRSKNDSKSRNSKLSAELNPVKNCAKNSEKSHKSKSNISDSHEIDEKDEFESDLEVVSYWSDSSNNDETGRSRRNHLKSSVATKNPLKASDSVGTKYEKKRSKSKDSSLSCSTNPSQILELHNQGEEFDKTSDCVLHSGSSDIELEPVITKQSQNYKLPRMKDATDSATGLEEFESRLLALYDNSMKQVRDSNDVKKQLGTLSGHIATECETESIDTYYNNLEERLCMERVFESQLNEKVEPPTDTTLFTKRMRDKFVKRDTNSDRIEESPSDPRPPDDKESKVELVDGVDVDSVREVEVDELQFISSPQISLGRGYSKCSEDELEEEEEELIDDTIKPADIGEEAVVMDMDLDNLGQEIVIDDMEEDLDAEEGEILDSEEAESDSNAKSGRENGKRSQSSHRHSTKRNSSKIVASGDRKRSHRHTSKSLTKSSASSKTNSKDYKNTIKHKSKHLTHSDKSSKRHHHDTSKSISPNRERKSSSKSRIVESHPKPMKKPNGKHSDIEKSRKANPKKCDANSQRKQFSKSNHSSKSRPVESSILTSLTDKSEEDAADWVSDVENQPIDEKIVRRKPPSPHKRYRKRQRSRSHSPAPFVQPATKIGRK